MGTKLVSYLNVRVKEINAQLKTNMDKAVMLVEGDAKRNAPVDTGYLRDHITSEVTGSDKEVVGTIGHLHYPATEGYNIYQEFGTSRMPAHPFLFPALESNKNKIVNILAEK